MKRSFEDLRQSDISDNTEGIPIHFTPPKEHFISFESEYQLEQFREIEKDHFTNEGNALKLYISTHLCERMLKLINQLETELKSKLS